MPTNPRNVGGDLQYTKVLAALHTAGGTENTASDVIDLLDIDSFDIVVVYTADVTATDTATVVIKYDTNTSNTVADPTSHTLKTDTTRTADGTYLCYASVDCATLDRYIKFDINSTLTKSGTDTNIVGAIMVSRKKSV